LGRHGKLVGRSKRCCKIARRIADALEAAASAKYRVTQNFSSVLADQMHGKKGSAPTEAKFQVY
jgi:hypothetical protein